MKQRIPVYRSKQHSINARIKTYSDDLSVFVSSLSRQQFPMVSIAKQSVEPQSLPLPTPSLFPAAATKNNKQEKLQICQPMKA